jgi:hypothetical protein
VGRRELPDVTLVAIDSVAHDLTRLAIEDTLREIEPAEVIWYSDRSPPFGAPHAIGFKLDSYDDVARTLWHAVPHFVSTSHFLVIQYDGWVLDGSAWRPEWLECDYIGAPWWYRDGFNVGNGGFSLRSTALMRWLASHDYPPRHPEDATLCREYRKPLEREGFIWASNVEARRFSFERTLKTGDSFGFHGLFNFPHILGREALLRRIELASAHVRRKPEWGEMMAAARPVLVA